MTRWENVIANRDKVSLVEIVTWNDFGESHYIGPQHGQLPPGSEAWVNGFDHSGDYHTAQEIVGATTDIRPFSFPCVDELFRYAVQDWHCTRY